MCKEQQKSCFLTWKKTEPWKPNNGSLNREKILLVKKKKGNRPARFYLEASATDLIQGKSDCGEERKNLSIHHAIKKKKKQKEKKKNQVQKWHDYV